MMGGVVGRSGDNLVVLRFQSLEVQRGRRMSVRLRRHLDIDIFRRRVRGPQVSSILTKQVLTILNISS